MLAYSLFIAFVTAFVVIAATGHVLLLTAAYPNLFGRLAGLADDDLGGAEEEFDGRDPAPQAPKLAV